VHAIVRFFYTARTSFNPSFNNWTCLPVKLPAFSVRKDLSRVINCEMLTDESLESPELFLLSLKLPGASAKRRFELITAAIIVLILLWLNSFDEAITTGRR